MWGGRDGSRRAQDARGGVFIGREYVGSGWMGARQGGEGKITEK